MFLTVNLIAEKNCAVSSKVTWFGSMGSGIHGMTVLNLQYLKIVENGFGLYTQRANLCVIYSQGAKSDYTKAP